MVNALDVHFPGEKTLLMSPLNAIAWMLLAVPLTASPQFNLEEQGLIPSEQSDASASSLFLDATRIAAKGISSPSLLASELAPQEVQSWPIDSWLLADIDGGGPLESESEIRARIESMAQQHPAAFFSPVFRGSDGGPVIVTPTILMRFAEGHRGEIARQHLMKFPALQILAEDWSRMPGAYKLAVNSGSGYEVLELCELLVAIPGVRYAEPDWIFTGGSAFVPNDTSFADQWALNNTGQSGGTVDMDINGPEAWNTTQGSASVPVVVIDTGVDQFHADLNLLPGADVTSDGPGDGGPVNSFDRHGTPVAGCVSATIDNALGISGSAPLCPTISVRTFITQNLLGTWTSQASWTVDALDHAQSVGARVTNNSNFYGFTSATIDDKYQETRDAGIAHFAAAGNNSNSTVAYPSELPTVQSVSSIDRNGNLSSFSNFGPQVSLTAPGGTVLCTDLTGVPGYDPGDYIAIQGTSQASPYCAGVAALILSHNPALYPDQVQAIMESTAKDLGAPGFDNSFAWGLVDAEAALAAADPCEVLGIFCESLPNSVGGGAQIGYTGTASIGANDLVLQVSGCPASIVGLFFYGPDQVQIPLADGLRCVGGSITRLSPRVTSGAGDTSESLDLSSAPFDAGSGQAVAGSTMNFQFWYRDQAAGGAGSNLSNALIVTFCN